MIPPSVKAAAVLTGAALIASVGPSGSTAASQPDDGKTPTLFGASVQTSDGQTYRQSLAQADKRFGHLDFVRYFDPDLPNDWDSIRADTGNRPVVVSFNAPPQEILAGTHDDALRQWFRTAPTTERLWWSYLPEPEEPSENGEFTPEQFSKAWAHIEDISDQVAPKNLRSALTLMTYTLNPYSERNWRDYYPGDEHVDVMAWDGYNWAGKDGTYAAPRRMYGKAVEVARSVDKPWGIAETGSVLTESDDDGSGRAAWLREVGRYTARHDASFVTYFHSDNGGDYRLEDSASQQAWRAVIDRTYGADAGTDTSETQQPKSGQAPKADDEPKADDDRQPKADHDRFTAWLRDLYAMVRTWHMGL